MRVWIIAAVLGLAATNALAQTATTGPGAPDPLYPRPESVATVKKPAVKSDYYQQAADPFAPAGPMTTTAPAITVPTSSASAASMWSSMSSGSALSPITDLSKSPFTSEPAVTPLLGESVAPTCTGEGVARVCN